MKPASAKAKGRIACKELKAALLEWAPDLGEDDIRVTSSGATGEDLLLSPAAQARYPFAIEVKNQEKINIWESYEQARAHAKNTKRMPLLVFRRNRSELMVSLCLEDFLKLIM